MSTATFSPVGIPRPLPASEVRLRPERSEARESLVSRSDSATHVRCSPADHTSPPPEPEGARAGAVGAEPEAGSAMGHLPEDKLGVCLKSMRASAALMRGARQLDFSGAVTMFAVPHEDQPYLDAHGWESHTGALRVVRVDGTHPDLVNPAYIPQIVAEAFDSGPAE